MIKRINLRTLLRFYDDKDFAPSLHAASVKSVLGEDLALALLIHYFKSNAYSARICDEKCNQGTKNGYRLDKWIEIRKANEVVIYQVEIKNWSVHSLGGKSIPPNTDEFSMQNFRSKRWAYRFDIHRNLPSEKATRKVLTKMKVPGGFSKAKHEALLCFWEPLHPDGKGDPLFEVNVSCDSFDRLTIFSMSNYVRLLLKTTDVLEVQMNDVDARIDLLNQIYF